MDIDKFLKDRGLAVDCIVESEIDVENYVQYEVRGLIKEAANKQLALYIVSGILPNVFKQLPVKLQSELVIKHTHAELVDGEKIVYEEQDVLDIIKYVSEGNYR
tara:strand:+ start:466 stop:777 length:312 start_codon:yes stop_codon:yes gene_type:complete